jgi:hypothetical protein
VAGILKKEQPEGREIGTEHPDIGEPGIPIMQTFINRVV